MSIYATLWWLKFPRYGDDYIGCEWIRVTAQGVPAHIGTPTRGFGYENGDPYAEFLAPAVEVNAEGDSEFMRAALYSSLRRPGRAPLAPLKSTRTHYWFFPARSTPRSRLSSCTRASVTLWGGKVQRSKRSCSQPMATSS